jgi:polyphosphate kinase 2 (PPK2 family)
MKKTKAINRRTLVRDEVADSFDEELELELDDERIAELLDDSARTAEQAARRKYFKELFRLQRELVKLQDWVVARQRKIVVLFEGRDAAGKGGVIVLFDRSWYNRAGVERVMGFCGEADVEQFFRDVPEFERMLVRSGITLMKYWFSITDEVQHLRFKVRIEEPLKQWKLSPMDLESRRRWEQYTKAKEAMLERTHIPEARWWVVEAVDKKRARLNCIHHLLSQIPYDEIPREPVALPARVHNPEYIRAPVPAEMYVPSIY